VLIDLWAFNSSTKPKINPIRASKPNKANNIGVQHVRFSLICEIIGGGTVLGA
jgi:hypothetical protein